MSASFSSALVASKVQVTVASSVWFWSEDSNIVEQSL
jgi:hypothetical protein